jgi:hypothetical protein
MLYLRVDDHNRAAFKEAESFPPLNYEKKGCTIDLSFWRAPGASWVFYKDGMIDCGGRHGLQTGGSARQSGRVGALGGVMKHFAGLDVSLQETAICIVDDDRIVINEGKVARSRMTLSAGWRRPA